MQVPPVLILTWADGGPGGSPGGPSRLWPGDVVAFGSCDCVGCGVDVVVPVDGLFPRRAAATAYDDHWRISNLSRGVVVTVSDLEDPGQAVRVDPGRRDVVVPFELARVAWGTTGTSLAAIAFGPEAGTVDDLPRCAATVPPPLLAGAVHAAVLAELSLARRRDPSRPLPSSAQISARLAASGVLVSARAVDRHIDYLVHKLGLDLVVDRNGHSRREVLAARAAEWALLEPAAPEAG